MIVVVAEVRMRLYHARTLKDKRQFVRSVVARLPQRFAVAAAEVDHLDDPRTVALGLAAVGNAKAHLETVLQSAIRFAAHELDGEIYDVVLEER
jgi:uncharacterized protein YlxP (DUF503 family)